MPTTAAKRRESDITTPESSTWQLQEAKNKFSEVVRRAQKEPQVVTVHGEPTVAVISYDKYREVVRPPKMSFLELMATCPPGAEELEKYMDYEFDATPREVEF
ncbi:MAG: type II toxin-antitoxin system Phd/YefM family antitoxin [Coriobacteriia bacterium]|nr:type II toxin-antitoxin system Phd/YefM family antitoxin [Coriobacteriia bacterium]